MHAEPIVREIVLAETTPATEWIGDRPVQKMSPTRRHGRLQLMIGAHIQEWARGKGEVASEWRFRITPRGSYTRPLVPDLAYLSFERSRGLTDAERETPAVPPDFVVEILSPDDRPEDVAIKREHYLAAGVTLVVIVDPETQRIDWYDDRGRHVSAIAPIAFEIDLYPSLSIPFAEILAQVDSR